MTSRRSLPDSLAAARPELADVVDEVGPALAREAEVARSLRDRLDDAEGLLGPGTEIPTAEIERALGEPFSETLNINNWSAGTDLAKMYERLEQEVADAVKEEGRLKTTIREKVFPAVAGWPGAPKGADVYQATLDQIKCTQTHALFNGATAAADGTVNVHDTIPVTIVQIGVALVSYAGEQGAWTHRVYRRDLRSRSSDPVEEALAVLEQRERRGGVGQPDKREKKLSELLGRGIMSFVERAVLADKTDAAWRVGHGTPAPYELLTGSGNMDLLHAGLDTVRGLVLDHRKIVYIPSAPGERLLLTIGNALRPLEFAVVRTDEARMGPIVENGHYGEKHRRFAEQFVRDVGPNVVIGVYRTYATVPPQIFYAHVDHAQEAALVAMADSMLQAHRGFPILIDVADRACKSHCGMDVFNSTIQAAYAAAGDPLTYLPERDTRG